MTTCSLRCIPFNNTKYLTSFNIFNLIFVFLFYCSITAGPISTPPTRHFPFSYFCFARLAYLFTYLFIIKFIGVTLVNKII